MTRGSPEKHQATSPTSESSATVTTRERGAVKSSCLVSDPMQTERLHDGRRRLLRDLVVEVDGKKITVVKGTVTDFSTIPWPGRFLVHWSKVDIAGVVHDWLYQTGSKTRSEADKTWRAVAMAGEHHANTVQAWIGWMALRIGGWWAWIRYRNRDRSINESAD